MGKDLIGLMGEIHPTYGAETGVKKRSSPRSISIRF
ncbi:hypothetical protein [Allobaculum sp. Allo2]|nr:hypothetical protein [Allobaculum sp. Allo2]